MKDFVFQFTYFCLFLCNTTAQQIKPETCSITSNVYIRQSDQKILNCNLIHQREIDKHLIEPAEIYIEDVITFLNI